MATTAQPTLESAHTGRNPVVVARMPAGVEMRPVSGLVAYEHNPRTHSAEQVAEIAASIVEFGWTNPVLINGSGRIIAGHGRVQAAQHLGLSQVPVLVRDDLTPAQERAYVIADNKLALNAGWDDALLASELKALGAQGYDLGLTGFDAGEIDALFDAAAGGDSEETAGEDDTPEPEATTVSRPGDIWLLGSHRLLCGDSTAPVDVGRLLAGAKPHLMVTDPPYGVEYDAAWRTRLGISSKGAAVGKVLNDDRADWREAWALFPGAVAYVWHAGTHCAEVQESLASCKFGVRAQIVWVKQRHVLSRGHYHAQHEPCLYAIREGEDEQWGFVADHDIASYAVRKGENGRWTGSRTQSTVWSIEHQASETGHSTQKPVECMRRPIVNNSRRGDAVYEPFAGSGTTIIAAESIGRRCYAIELSPAYCDVIVRRWQSFTRREATLEGDGQAFAAIEAARSAAEA
jgi:DNA modification methylase